jgi:hypothetical protein
MEQNQASEIPGEVVQIRRSPLIPRSIDNTALDAYMSCPRKYYYGMELGRRRSGLQKPALAYGTTWHKILETHYRTGGDHAAVVNAAISSWQPHDNPDDHRTLDRAITSYDQFLEKFGDFKTEQQGWGVTVGYPETPVVELATEIWWPGALHPYAGKIDRVFEFQGLYYVEDHKTTSALGAQYFNQFDPSNQMMGYAALAQLLTGLPIAGVRINAHGVLKTMGKFERKIIPYSQPRLQEWQRNYTEWIGKLEKSYKIMVSDPDMLTPDEVLLEAFPHNFNACAGKYGMCSYAEVCANAPQIRQRILEADFEVMPWDPMAAADLDGGMEA